LADFRPTLDYQLAAGEKIPVIDDFKDATHAEI
jgi:hypothetical protein